MKLSLRNEKCRQAPSFVTFALAMRRCTAKVEPMRGEVPPPMPRKSMPPVVLKSLPPMRQEVPPPPRQSNFYVKRKKSARSRNRRLINGRLRLVLRSALILVVIGLITNDTYTYLEYEVITVRRPGADPHQKPPISILCLRMLDKNGHPINSNLVLTPADFQNQTANFDDLFSAFSYFDGKRTRTVLRDYSFKDSYRKLVDTAVKKARFRDNMCFYLDWSALYPGRLLRQVDLRGKNFFGELMSMELNITKAGEIFVFTKPRGDHTLEYKDFYMQYPLNQSGLAFVSVRKYKNRLLPKPYNMECHEYDIDPRFKSAGDCRSQCHLDKILKSKNEIPNIVPFFDYSSTNYTSKITFVSRRCWSLCRDPCHSTTFESKVHLNRYESSDDLTIFIFLPQVVSYVETQPKMLISTLFFNINGFASFTMGWNIYSMVMPILSFAGKLWLLRNFAH